MPQAVTDPAGEYLTPREVAEVLRVSDTTLRNWRSNGNGPPWTRVEGVIRYPKGDFYLWLEERTTR